MNRFLIVFLLLLVIFNSAYSQKIIGLRLYTENDFFSPIGQNTDDNYTGGVRFELITNLGSSLFKGKILNPLQWVPVMQSFSFSVTAFTPNDLSNPNANTGERPYASYQSWNFGSTFTKGRNRLSYELSLGSMGKSLAGDAQKKIHGEHWFNTNRPIPQGWQYQVAAGGAFAANMNIKYEKLILGTLSNTDFQWLAGSWTHELNVGQYMINYTQGVRFYFLNYNHPFPNEEDAPAINAFAPGAVNRKKFGFFCFVTPRLKTVLHNATITGKLLSAPSIYILPQSDLKNVLLEYDAGVMVRYGFFRLGYNLFGRSREYKGEAKFFHNWGGIYFGFIGRFK